MTTNSLDTQRALETGRKKPALKAKFIPFSCHPQVIVESSLALESADSGSICSPVGSCGTWDRFLGFSETQIPLLQNGNNKTYPASHAGILRGLKRTLGQGGILKDN